MENIIKNIFIVAVAVFINTGCTEKIDLNLKNSSPQLTIQGSISDDQGQTQIVLTKSRLYDQDNSFEGVPSAIVVISDDAGNIDTLSEIIPGLYQSNSIQGTAGRTYRLDVTSEGVTYTSVCKMPFPVDIDSIVLSVETDFRGNAKNEADILVRDPTGVKNQYRVVSYLNGEISSGFHIHTDRLWDGKLRSFNVPQDDFKSGDTLRVKLQSLDEHIYKYFSEFNQNQNNFGAPAAPANPDPVFTPPALGYFSAHSVKSKSIIIP